MRREESLKYVSGKAQSRSSVWYTTKCEENHGDIEQTAISICQKLE